MGLSIAAGVVSMVCLLTIFVFGYFLIFDNG